MSLRQRWPALDNLCQAASGFPSLEVWAFGSMLTDNEPSDLDVLIVYLEPTRVESLRSKGFWEMEIPPIEIIAMTPDEEAYYQFIEVTGAVRIYP